MNNQGNMYETIGTLYGHYYYHLDNNNVHTVCIYV